MRSWRYLWSLAAALGLAMVAGAPPAQAQFFGSWGYPVAQPPELMPETVARQLARAGFKVRRVERNGRVFVVDGADKGGQPVRLVVHPASGEILQRYAMVHPRGAATDAAGQGRQPVLASPEGAQPAHKPSRQGSRPKPAPSQATVAPAPPTAAPEQPRPEPAAPVTAAAPAPQPAPVPSAPPPPGYANGVPINPLD